MALIICDECGRQVSDKATACPQCGAPILHRENLENTASNENKEFGTLRIVWPGKWMLMNTPIHIYVNGENMGVYPFTSGFDMKSPIRSNETLVEVKCGFRTSKIALPPSPKTDYTLKIQYSRLSGAFGFYLTDENGRFIMPAVLRRPL